MSVAGSQPTPDSRRFEVTVNGPADGVYVCDSGPAWCYRAQRASSRTWVATLPTRPGDTFQVAVIAGRSQTSILQRVDGRYVDVN